MGLHVTGENISNANTEGYSRKRLALVAESRKDGAFGQVGFGVDVRFIERVRNAFVDKQLVEQLATHGYKEMVNYGFERIENIHQEPSENGIAQVMEDFWDAWSDVANNPSDKSSRETLKSTTIVMTERFHYTAQEMRNYKLSINDEIEAKTKQLNNLAKQISDLNYKVVNSESIHSQNANDSRDLRDTLLKELADMVSISYVEDSTGAVTVTTGGNMLVSPQRAFELETVRHTLVEPDGFRFTYNGLRFVGTHEPFVPQNGELKALFDIRDEIIPSFEKELDVLVTGIVREVNEAHAKGYTIDHLTCVEFFDSSKTSAITMSLSAAIMESSNNIAAAQGGNVVTPMDATLAMDSDNTLTLTNVDLKYRDIVEGSVKVVDTATGYELLLGADKDYVIDHELGRVRILNPAYAAGHSFTVSFQYNDRGFSGEGDGNNALNISLLRSAKTMNEKVNGSYANNFNEFYAGYIGRLGVERNQAKLELETQHYLVAQLSNQQESISGVNLDEEIASLIKYQHTFQASARFLTTIGDMLDVLMRM